MAADLIHQKTNKVLVSMSLPISIGMLSTFLFQVIDTYFVGQLGPESLAALSFSSTVYFLAVGLFMGFAVGVSIIVGKAVGAQETDRVNQVTLVSIFLCLVLSALLSLIGIVFVEPIFSALGASETILPLVKEYIVPLLYGIPLLTIGILGGSILRATGVIKAPEIIMGIAGVINLVFDYALIFGKFGLPELGIKGAAYATVLSWVFVIVGMFVLLIKHKRLLAKLSEVLKNFTGITKDIYKLGLPTIVTQMVGPLTLMYLTFLLAQQSELSVAAYGVASRIETLIMIGILGVSSALTPFIAQNLGAKEHDRIDQAIVFGGRASTYIGLVLCLLMLLLIKPIAGLFSDDTEVIRYTSMYFYLVSASYIFYGLFLVTSSIFNGLQLPVNSMKIMVVKSLGFTLPLTFIGSYFGITGIFLGVTLGNVLAGVYAGYVMRKQFKKVGSPLAKANIWQEYKGDFKRLLGNRNGQ